MDIDQLWREMEQEPGSLMGGWVQRRLLPHSGLDVFVTLARPGERRTLRLSVPASLVEDGMVLKDSRGIEARVVREVDENRRSLLLSLQDPKYAAVFTSLCNDLVELLGVHSGEEAKALRAFLDRLERWQHFLERVGAAALSAESQLGLYAELTVLLDDILSSPSTSAGTAWWTGPEGTHQDFQLSGTALEVKATRQSSPSRIIISSERQLDSAGVSRLLLVWSVWDVRRGDSATLPARIDAIRARLQGTAWLDLFENRLLAVGYSDMHRHLYSDTTYALRKEAIFDVRPGFPRLTEGTLPAGVSAVSYSIDLAMCRPFEVGRSVLAGVISGGFHGPA